MIRKRALKKRTPLLLLPFLFAASLLNAESINFRQAIELAMKHSGVMATASAERARAAARYHAERYNYLPTIIFGSNLGYTFGQPITIAGQAPSLFNVSHEQSVFNLSVQDSVRAAHSDSIAAGIDYADKAEQVILDTALVYIELDSTQQRLELARQQKQAVDIALSIAQQRQQAGITPEIDTKRAELDSARVELSIAQLETSIDVLRERLSRSTGLSAATLETVSSSIPEPPPVPAEDELANVALTNSAAVRIADEHVRAARARARAEHHMNYPSFDFAGQFAEYSTFNNYQQYYVHFSQHNYSFGINLRIPVFNLAQSARAAAADAEALRSEGDAQTARDQVAADAVRAQHAVHQLQLQAKVARLEYEVAQANIDAVTLQVQNGHATVRDQEMAHADIALRRAILLQSQFEYLRAQLQLLRQTGDLRGWALGQR